MSITRKWSIARVEHIDDDGVSWIAECRAGTGTWVIRDVDTDDLAVFGIVGEMFEFPEESGLLLTMTVEQRAKLRMSDEVYQLLNVELRLQQERSDQPVIDRDIRVSVDNLRRRIDALETRP